MSRLLDPMHRRQIESLGVGAGARALEVGCGNGSISAGSPIDRFLAHCDDRDWWTQTIAFTAVHASAPGG
jgi:hypothetical protein